MRCWASCARWNSATLTKRIAEGLGAEAPPPAERPAAIAAACPDGSNGSSRAASRRRRARRRREARRRPSSPRCKAATRSKIDRSKYETVTELPQLEAWIAEARAAGRFAFDTETTSLDPMQAEFVGFSMAVAPGKACYVPLAHRAGSGSFDFGDANPKQVPVSEALAVLKPLLEDPSVLKIGQNLKFDCLVLHRHGIALAPLDDTMLMSYALDAGRGQHGMDTLAERHLKHTCMPFTQVLEHAPGAKKSDKTFAQVPLDKATEYAGEDADVTLRLWMALKPRLAAERMTTRLRDAGAAAGVRAGRHGARRRQGRPDHPVAADVDVRAARGAAGGRRSTIWPGTSSTWDRPSSSASSCSTTSSCRAAARPRRGSGRRAPACSTIWPPARNCPSSTASSST